MLDFIIDDSTATDITHPSDRSFGLVPRDFAVDPVEMFAAPTDMPTGKEWDAAKKVRTARDEELPCQAAVLRDWLRIECKVHGASQFAGDPADVKIIAPRFPLFGVRGEDIAQETTIFVHLRRGEAQMFAGFRIDDAHTADAP